MIRDLRPSGKGFGTRALKNHEIAFGKSSFQRRIKRLHHGNVENVERWAVERNPRRAMFEPKLDRFLYGGHDGSRRFDGKASCPETLEAAFRKTPEFPRCSPPTNNNESVPGLHYREPGQVPFPGWQTVLSSPHGWPVTVLEQFSAQVFSLPLRAARPERPD